MKKLNTKNASNYFLGLLRIALGWIFLWPFLDKMFGLGYTTSSAKAMINGNSPTYGFLNFGTGTWFGHLFANMSSNGPNQIGVVDILFMLGLFAVGTAFILGIAMRIAGYGGAMLMGFLYLAVLPFIRGTDHNPILDDHIIYGLAALYFAHSKAGNFVGLGNKWKNLEIVKNNRVLS